MGRALTASDVRTGREPIPGTLTFREQHSPAPINGHLSECWSTPVENVVPVRVAAAFKGQRNFAGLWWCATNRRHVGFESWCERDQLMNLDFDPRVVGISSQPFRVTLPASLPQHSHVPDYFVRYGDGTGLVIDVRPDARVKPADQSDFDATAQLCATVAWAYQRLGELPSTYRANLRWIAGYRHPRCMRDPSATLSWKYLNTSGPASVREVIEAVGESVIVLPILFHMLWTQEILTDLGLGLLHSDTILWLGGSP